jgi:siroheme synthase-like protein
VTVPLFVRLEGARVVCVGAGPVAAGKALPLLDAGADLVVVAPDAVPEVRAAAEASRLTWRVRGWEPQDLEGALLVVAGTADPQVNAEVADAAAKHGRLCVRVDREGEGSADLASVVRRGALTLAVSTSGRAPALARRVREELEADFGPEWGEAVELYAVLRADEQVRAALAGLPDAERRARWRAIPLPDILDLLRSGRFSDAKRAASACLSSSSD